MKLSLDSPSFSHSPVGVLPQNIHRTWSHVCSLVPEEELRSNAEGMWSNALLRHSPPAEESQGGMVTFCREDGWGRRGGIFATWGGVKLIISLVLTFWRGTQVTTPTSPGILISAVIRCHFPFKVASQNEVKREKNERKTAPTLGRFSLCHQRQQAQSAPGCFLTGSARLRLCCQDQIISVCWGDYEFHYHCWLQGENLLILKDWWMDSGLNWKHVLH